MNKSSIKDDSTFEQPYDNLGNLLDENEVLDWMVKQKTDESIEEIDRDTLSKYIETKEFLAVVFCKIFFLPKRLRKSAKS